MPRSIPLDPTEQQIVERATRFYVTAPIAALGARTEQRTMTCYHFSLGDASEYARWLQKLLPALRNRVLVYAAECDHPEAPSELQQWRTILVPREHWL